MKNKESDPEVFAGGAHYHVNREARAGRSKREKEIDATLRKEGLVKDEFKGLTAAEATKVGEAVKLGGVEVVIDDGSGEGGTESGERSKKKKNKKMPKKLREKMAKQKAAAAGNGAGEAKISAAPA